MFKSRDIDVATETPSKKLIIAAMRTEIDGSNNVGKRTGIKKLRMPRRATDLKLC